MNKTVRITFVEMLQELPPDTCVWALVDRSFSASDMISLIQKDSAEGTQYITDTLRISRDILISAARGYSLRKRVEEILSKPYERVFEPEDYFGYSASIPEFPGCFADGDNLEEAKVNLELAARSWVEAALEQGYKIREAKS